MRTKAKLKKAEQEREKAAADVRGALNDAAKALRDLSSALMETLRSAGLDERAEELATRLRESETLAKLAAGGQQVASKAREAAKEAGLDARAAEVASKLRESEATKQALARAAKVSDEAYAKLGKRLATGKAAERLGVEPRKRRFPTWLAALLGLAAGAAVSLLAKSQKREGPDDFELAAQRLTQEGADGGTTAEPSTSLEDRIRDALRQDPRTASLPRLNINVAEGTVFVRGEVPSGSDESAIRDVIAGVEGVEDVDLQVTTKT